MDPGAAPTNGADAPDERDEAARRPGRRVHAPTTTLDPILEPAPDGPVLQSSPSNGDGAAGHEPDDEPERAPRRWPSLARLLHLEPVEEVASGAPPATTVDTPAVDQPVPPATVPDAALATPVASPPPLVPALSPPAVEARTVPVIPQIEQPGALVTHKVFVAPGAEPVPPEGASAISRLVRRPARPSITFQRRSTRPRVRRVTRVVRHIDTWSVFKVALVFSVFLYAVALTAGVLLWHVAMATGTIDNVERFFEGFGWESFQFKGGEIYHSAWIIGLFAIVGLTGLAVLAATLFNLITDLVGGIRVSVLEEEVLARRDRSPTVVHEQLPMDGDLYDQARHG